MIENARLKMDDFNNAGGKIIFLRNSAFDLSLAVTGILDRIKKVKESLNGRPLVVLMGEDHRVSSHILLQLLTLSDLHEKYESKVGFATEMSHNLPTILRSKNGHDIEDAKSFFANDVHGQLSLNEINASLCIHNAPISYGALLELCAKKKISTCFADVARHPKESLHIDLEDEVLINTIGHDKLCDLSFLSGISAHGMAIRNLFMKDMVLKHIQKTQVDILMMSVGVEHIFGDPRNSFFKDSLASHFHQAGIDFLAVMPFGRNISIHHIPAEASELFRHSIGVMGMDETPFPCGTKANELDYMFKVMKSSGRDFKFY